MQRKTSMETPDASPAGSIGDMAENQVRPDDDTNAAAGVPMPDVPDVSPNEQTEDGTEE